MKKTSRRTFVKNTSLGLAALTIPVSSYSRIIGSNERINVAVIGVNGRGMAHVSAVSALKNGNIMALCDVDSKVLGERKKKCAEMEVNISKTETDFRKLLDDKDIDVVTIAAPDHWHAPMAILAMQAGKDVYLEKPFSHNPQEGEWLVEAQRKTGKVLQIGNQQRSAPTSMEAMQDIKEGIIGDVHYAKAWYSNTRGSIGRGKKVTVPKHLDWELFQGPAPREDYRDNLVHYNWHWFWNWGTGEINNNGLHEMDICRWALGVDYPMKVTSSGGRFHFNDDWEFYDTQVASFEFPDGKMITWEGRSCNGLPHLERGRGATIHGTDGSILLDRNDYYVYDKKNKVVKNVKERSQSATTNIVGMGGLDVYHMNNFFNAISKGEALNSNAVEAHKSTLMCHLGNIAQKYERTLHTDPANGKIKNDKEAMSMWSRKYAPGWQPKV
jgi:predicted dehydrogenase